jgi:hypothetical protein
MQGWIQGKTWRETGWQPWTPGSRSSLTQGPALRPAGQDADNSALGDTKHYFKEIEIQCVGVENLMNAGAGSLIERVKNEEGRGS